MAVRQALPACSRWPGCYLTQMSLRLSLEQG
jgi:hypothetical protein